MRVQRGSNIDSLLARKLEDDGSRLWDFGEQGRQASVDGRRIREYFVAKGKPDNYQYSPSEAREAKNYFKAIDRSQIKKARDKQLAMIDAQMMDKGSIGEFEGKEIAEMNAVLADPESSPPISKIGSLLSAEGESGLDQAGRDMMDRRKIQKGKEASMKDFGGEEGGGFWNEAMGLLDSDSIGTPGKKKYRDVDTEGDNKYLNKLAREEFEKKQAVYGMDDLNQRGPTVDTGESALDRISAENRGRAASMASFKGEEGGGILNEALGLFDSDSIGTPTDPYMSSENLKGENRYLNKLAREKYKSGKVHPFADTASYSKIKEDTEGESALDKIGRENMLNDMDDLGPDKTDVESSFWERTKQGRVGDAFSGLFSSDDSGRDESLAKEKKDNEALSGKIGAAAKLYSLLKPEQQQAAPTIPTASISRGSVAFPGMQLASQKARRKYFTPKGLMA